MQIKLNIFVKKFDNVRFCVRPLCEQLFNALDANDIYVTTRTWNSGTDMAISLLHFSAFFQGEDKSIERGEKHFKSGHVESFSYADGKIVGLVHAGRREHDVTYETCSPGLFN